MLILTRKPQEGIILDDGRVWIRILEVTGSRVKLGVEASRDVSIVRDELMPHGRPLDPVTDDSTVRITRVASASEGISAVLLARASGFNKPNFSRSIYHQQ